MQVRDIDYASHKGDGFRHTRAIRYGAIVAPLLGLVGVCWQIVAIGCWWPSIRSGIVNLVTLTATEQRLIRQFDWAGVVVPGAVQLVLCFCSVCASEKCFRRSAARVLAGWVAAAAIGFAGVGLSLYAFLTELMDLMD